MLTRLYAPVHSVLQPCLYLIAFGRPFPKHAGSFDLIRSLILLYTPTRMLHNSEILQKTTQDAEMTRNRGRFGQARSSAALSLTYSCFAPEANFAVRNAVR